MPITITRAGIDNRWGRNLRRQVGTSGRVRALVWAGCCDVPAGALDVCVVMGQLLQVDLGGVRLREAAQTRRRVIAAVDVLQRDRPVLGGVKELLLGRELDLR